MNSVGCQIKKSSSNSSTEDTIFLLILWFLELSQNSTFFFIHLFICACIVPFLPPATSTLPLTPTPSVSRQNLFCFFSNFVEE
jgi:hypothetical protein